MSIIKSVFAGQSYTQFVFAFLIACAFAAQPMFAQDNEDVFDKDGNCISAVSEAEKLFFNAAFEPAIEILNDCLPADSINNIERAEIYLLLSRIYFANQQEAQAAEALSRYFDIRPFDELDAFLPPPFVEFAEHIREIMTNEEPFDKQLVPLPQISEETKQNYKRWALIGGSGIFAIATVAIMSSGRSSNANKFPPVPAPPGGQ